MTRLAFFTALFITSSLFCQQNRIWDFGGNVRFSFPGPVVSTGPVNTAEGSATVCTPGGALQLSTNGVVVYNASGAIMTNGTGLLGHPSTTNSAIAIHRPGTINTIYIFTIGQLGATMHYNVVDMTASGGMGSVVTKNVPMAAPLLFREGLTAARSCTGDTVWIIAKRAGSNQYYSWPLTGAGVGAPVISATGLTSNIASQHIGSTKASPDGCRVVTCFFGLNQFEVVQFNRVTGVLSGAVTYAFNGCYDSQYSPNNQLLYITTNQGRVTQYSAAMAPTDIRAQQPTVLGGSLSIAPDGKIYHSSGFNNHVSIIHNPNTPGLGCNFQFAAITTPGESRMGLPNFAPFYSYQPPSFTFTQISCNTYQFTSVVQPICGNQSITWQFPNGTTSAPNPVWTLPTGTNAVTLRLNLCNGLQSTQTINVNGGIVGRIAAN